MLSFLFPLVLLAGTDGPPIPPSLPRGATVSGELDQVLVRALSVPGARVTAVAWDSRLPPACTPRTAATARTITGSGRVAVRLRDAGCPTWAFLRVEVWAPAAVTTRPLRAGEAIDGASVLEDREVRNGHTPWLPPSGALASRNLPSGKTIEPVDVAGAALAAGATVKVVVTTGALSVEVQGRALACGAGRACAVLPSGRHVEGRMDDGRLWVEVP